MKYKWYSLLYFSKYIFTFQILVDDSQLLEAAESGDVDGVKQMIADCVDVNTRNEVCITAF